MKMKITISYLLPTLVLTVISCLSVSAQSFTPEYNPLYDDSRVAKVMITIDEALLDSILAPGNEESDVEHPAMFEYDDGSTVETVDLVGFRLRGNTSRFSKKQSFKVSFNTFVQGQEFHDVEKLNLNGEHNDPSIIRSKVAWDLFQGQGVAAPRAAHVELYINGVYRGLYANVEHIDEEFLKSRFGSDAGNLYKCLWPADLTYLGPTADDYRPTGDDRRPYDLKLKDSDLEGYDDLAHFIDVLNNSSDAVFAEEIEKVFNVNGFLRSIAVDIVTGSWDNYLYLKNNFYLYFNPRTGVFEYIPYDFDNTFGIWWDFIEPGIDWADRDIYSWGNPNEDRPLSDRILSIDTYVDRLSFYIDRLMQDSFVPGSLKTRVDELHALVTTSAEADTFRVLDYGYTNQDFHDSFEMALGDHVTYGLKPFIDARFLSLQNQLDLDAVRPIITDGYYEPNAPSSAQPISFFVTVDDDEVGTSVEVTYELNGSSGSATLFDDGAHGDGEAGDGRYAGELPALEENGELVFQFVATETGGKTSASSPRTIELGFTGLPLFINEIMASNDTTFADPSGDYDDWVEIVNMGTESINLQGYFFSDDVEDPTKWAAPDYEIQPQEFLVLWLDEDDEQGSLHGPFKLSAGGEDFVIFDTDGAIVDAVTFGEQETDVSYGRTEDGMGHFDFLDTPTPGNPNLITINPGVGDGPDALNSWTLEAYPNPFRGKLQVRLSLPNHAEATVEVYDLVGRLVKRLGSYPPGTGSTEIFWDGTDASRSPLASGMYLISVADQAGRITSSIPVVLTR